MTREEKIEILEILSDQKHYYGLKLIRDFMTNRCNVMLCDCDCEILGEHLYAVISRHLDHDGINIRFGNKVQVESIIDTYHIEKEFHL